MKRRDVRVYLFDIIQAAQRLAQFACGKTFADYERDAMLRSAVERQFEIIGEALSQALQVAPALEAQIGGARRVVAFRNRLIHGDASIANDIIWNALQNDLPALREQIEELLAESE